jgi:SNF2 family DNA or RNA helicase
VLETSPLHGFYYAHDVGIGKTVTAIATARLLGARRVLIVTTVNGVGVWQQHLRTWWPEVAVSVLREQWPEHLPVEDCQVYLTSWGQLVATGGQTAEAKIHRRRTVRSHLALLEAAHPDLSILDESHIAKGAASDVSRAAWRLERASAHRLRLSGTTQHRYFDLWAQYRYLCPDPLLQSTFKEFREQLAVFTGPQGNWFKAWRPEGLSALARALAPYTHVVTNEVLQLPAPQFQTVSVTLSPSEQRIYDQMERESYVAFDHGGYADARIILTRLLRLQQITSGHLPVQVWEPGEGEDQLLNRWTEPIGDSKLRAVLAAIDQRPRQKILVGCRFLPEMVRLEAALRPRGRWIGRVQGNVTAAARAQLEREFQETATPAVVPLQFATATAMTLTAADAVLLVSPDPKVINFRQFMGRAYRRGQTKPLEVLAFLARRTVDESIYQGLQEGASVADLGALFWAALRARRATEGGPHGPAPSGQ